MESKSKRTPSGLNLIASGKWNQVSERGLAPWPWICWIWSNGPSKPIVVDACSLAQCSLQPKPLKKTKQKENENK